MSKKELPPEVFAKISEISNLKKGSNTALFNYLKGLIDTEQLGTLGETIKLITGALTIPTPPNQESSQKPLVCGYVVNRLGVHISKQKSVSDCKELAVFCYNKAVERDCPNGMRNFAFMKLFGIGTVKDAICALEWAQKASDSLPGDPDKKITLALCLEANDRVDEAISTLEETLKNEKLEKQHVNSTRYHLAVYYEKKGDLIKAWELLNRLNDVKDPMYKQYIDRRNVLLKKQVDSLFSEPEPADMVEDQGVEHKVSDSEGEQVPGGGGGEKEETRVATVFSRKLMSLWTNRNDRFHTVDEERFKDESQKRNVKTSKVISGILAKKEILEEDRGDENDIERTERERDEYREFEDECKLHQKHLSSSYRSTFRRHITERTFFDPARLKKGEELIQLTKSLIDQRYTVPEDGEEAESVKLDGMSSRLLISAERVFQEAILTLSGEESFNSGIPVIRRKPWRMGYCTGHTLYGPKENYSVGASVIQAEHRVDPKRDRLGDSFLCGGGTYTSIMGVINNITLGDPLGEIELAKIMIKYSRNHQEITHENLTKINPQVKEETVNEINRLCFLIVEKEQPQWHSAQDEEYLLGISVSQARCLIMLEKGYLTFEDAFSRNSVFGAYTQTNILREPKKVAEACRKTDALYINFLRDTHPEFKDEHKKFTREQVSLFGEVKNSVVLTRQQAHIDLKYIHDNPDDPLTDGEDGYESDLSFS